MIKQISVLAASLLAGIALSLMPFPAQTNVAGPTSGAIPSASSPPITQIDPPEKGFYSKEINCRGILVKSSAVVADAALYAACDRIGMELKNLPVAAQNLAAAKAEVHIIGKDQVTSDLPEFRDLKGKPLPEYNGLTVDQRTRGLGGLWTSCGEENLLHLPGDRYQGRDILIHEFAHNIRNNGVQDSVVKMFDAQYKASLKKGLWVNSYAGSNPNEWFAELSMWYFGTHGDEHMTGPKPADGPQGLKAYDPQAYALFDDFYSGRIPVERLPKRHHHYGW